LINFQAVIYKIDILQPRLHYQELMRLIKLMAKILKYIAGLIILLTFLSFLLFNFVWHSHSVNTLSGARDLFKQHGTHEHKVALNECIKLMKSGKTVKFHQNEIPQPFKVLSPEYIRASEFSCEINLYKVPGKGIAYWVRKSNNGQYELSWADYFKSWDSHVITVE